MVSILGFEAPVSLNLSGILSTSILYISLFVFLTIFGAAAVALLLFFKTYNKKVVLFDDISGQGYQPVLKTRARTIRVDKTSGEELLKTLAGKIYLSAYGRKMGKNTYWFAKGPDGYFYNVTLGDLDTKMGVLDIEPVDRDVRMFHVALNRLAHQEYGKKNNLPTIMVGIGVFLALVILLIGMYMVAGRFIEAANSLASTASTNQEVLKGLNDVLKALANIKSQSGVVPAG